MGGGSPMLGDIGGPTPPGLGGLGMDLFNIGTASPKQVCYYCYCIVVIVLLLLLYCCCYCIVLLLLLLLLYCCCCYCYCIVVIGYFTVIELVAGRSR